MARLFPGLAAPLVFIGIECQRTNNLPLAEKLLSKACEVCPHSSLACHELGVVLFRSNDLEGAERQFVWALSLVPGFMAEARSATLVCLGHCLRKRGDFAGALGAYRQALSLQPGRAGTLAAEAYTLHLMGDLGAAIDGYHRALTAQPGHPFACDMLPVAIEQHARDAPDLRG